MFAVGSRVKVLTLQYEHSAVVTHNGGYMGLDGRWWIGVSVTYSAVHPPAEFHFEKHELEEVE